ncbi:hypothetical protein Cch01nite_23640 [Cellulomonas chitinilytica]|uniref:Uncharacterized protein n=1 Tax=Cellulomonas chitinilytica TaxID=398759 RepID=A0A919P2S6_9CELL|nr:hypothetical protein [Cellulomonas chitinilytica]GIG21640.1 hypothetical protein Cch01nite_23640 [Cellulomonas chitinilytica]
MRTVVVAGTAGGVGATTLVALAHTGLRGTAAGAPWVLGPDGGDTGARSRCVETTALDTGAAIWDAGVLRADATLAQLVTPDLAVAVVAPSTPRGIADAGTVLEALGEADPALAARSCLVLTEVHGRPLRVPPAPHEHVLRVPFDPALAAPGPLADDAALRSATRRGVEVWRAWVADAVGRRA